MEQRPLPRHDRYSFGARVSPAGRNLALRERFLPLGLVGDVVFQETVLEGPFIKLAEKKTRCV